jgi:tetratricopeptide (TPR) repeat protein
VFLFLVPFLLLSCGALWQSDTNRAVEQARTGEYDAAASVLESAVAGGNIDPKIVESLYYSWIRRGEYAKARERFDAWAAANPNAGPVRLAAGRVNHLTGNYAQATTHFDAILNNPAVRVAANYEKARVLSDTGKRAQAETIYNRLIRDFQSDAIRNNDDLLYVAGAMQATEYFYDANDVFKFITRNNQRNAEAYVAWGNLLAEKYNEPESIASYQDALEIDPKMPEANLGLAKQLALTDPEKSSQALQLALETNPNYIDGHIFVASQQIESEQYDRALETLTKVFAINPQSLEAFSMAATIHFVRGNKAEFDQNVQRVLTMNPEYNNLYYILAENSVMLRLYKEAVGFAREAVRLNPRDFRSMGLLGMNLLRIGEEQAGKETLERAYEGDKFNVWNVNTLTLLDSFVNFDRFQTANFNVMLHKKESAQLRPYVTDLLEKAYRDLSAKYEFKPETPLVFEMFPDHGDFAVRTLGLPGLGALGVCFGKVVVMDSPSARKPDTFNWGSTLWHEFMHVITLQMTDHKVPRWFSEGLSVFEERKAFPGWGDDLKMEYLQAIKEKKLLPIADLNDGFIRPQYPEQVLVSYYQASLVSDYIEQKFGFPAIRRMLMLYKEGRTTPQVFQEALNLRTEDFDKQFLAWVDDRVKAINPENFGELITSGEQALEKGEVDRAIETLNRAIAMYPEYTDEHNPYEPLAQAYLKKGDKKAAIDTLKKYMTYSEVSYTSFIQLANLLEEGGDSAGARQALEGSVYIRPLDMEAHERLGKILLAQNEYSAAAREYETLIALNAPDRAGAYYRLAEAKLGEGKRDEARSSVLKSLEIAPSYEPALELLLKIRGR